MLLRRRQDPTAVANSSQERVTDFYACLREDIWDYHADPGSDGQDPARYVNYQAFVSLVNEGSFWNPSTVDALAIKEDHKKEPSSVRDAWVMGAAQWILWGGQSLREDGSLLCSVPCMPPTVPTLAEIQ